MTAAGQSLWAALHLLDRQILDREGRPVAKVDDLQIDPAPVDGELPMVSGILCGPAVLGQRFGPRVGGFVEGLRNLTASASGRPPDMIPMDLVADIGPALTLTVRRDSLPLNRADAFLGEHVIGHIPGAGQPGPGDGEEPHESE